MQTLSAQEARQISLASLGVTRGLETIDQVIETLNLIQIDSVNVFARAHLMPVFTRIGNYDLAEFERLAFGAGAKPTYLEYWAHCAALIPERDWKLFEFRRNEYLNKPSIQEILKPGNKTAQWVFSELRQNGAMTISEFEHDLNKRGGSWWGWSEVKVILERLVFAGVVVSAGRHNFQRKYSLNPSFGETSGLTKDQQIQALLVQAATSLGVATEADLADYYRLTRPTARPHLKQLVEQGALEIVEVDSWKDPAFIAPGLLSTPKADVSDQRPLKLVNPFDPIMWNRERTKRLFDFDYLIEIYTPEAKRKYGYYTLGLLYGDRLIGRVDLKHERKGRKLLVQALWHETLTAAELTEITPWLKQELELAMNWVGAETLIPPTKGNWPLMAGLS